MSSFPCSSGMLGQGFLVLHEIFGGRAAWGRVCGRAKLGAGTLRCLRLCWRLPWDWSDKEQLGRCPKPHKGRCPLTLQGADEKGRSPPLDPFSRLSWSRFHAPSACSFLALRLSPCLLPNFSCKTRFFLLAPLSSPQTMDIPGVFWYTVCKKGCGITQKEEDGTS